MSSKRPFRVWDLSRRLKRSLVASSFVELQQKSKEKLEFESNIEVTVVLEIDGTVVEDEEYFNFLDDDTTFMVLKDGEKWAPRQKEGQDETDFAYKAALGQKPVTNSLQDLAGRLRQDLSKIVLFSREQLQTLVDSDESELCQLLGNSIEDTKSIQSACQRYLDEKQQVNDAVQLLTMLKNVDQVDGKSPNKRQRTQ